MSTQADFFLHTRKNKFGFYLTKNYPIVFFSIFLLIMNETVCRFVRRRYFRFCLRGPATHPLTSKVKPNHKKIKNLSKIQILSSAATCAIDFSFLFFEYFETFRLPRFSWKRSVNNELPLIKMFVVDSRIVYLWKYSF